jgi:hypothetical protein
MMLESPGKIVKKTATPISLGIHAKFTLPDCGNAAFGKISAQALIEFNFVSRTVPTSPKAYIAPSPTSLRPT